MHIFLKILAVLCLALGVLGLFLPIIPGIPLILIGLILLGEESWLGGKIISMLPEKLRKAIRREREKLEKEDK